mgnify:CR=1 FL=1|tara:strand:+ start:302 stop:496 length:195 start_codon:yes stop_codon:yes gene_type:complete
MEIKEPRNVVEKSIKIGKIYRYHNDYVLPVKKLRDRAIDRVGVYSVLFPDGTTDIITETLMKEI